MSQSLAPAQSFEHPPASAATLEEHLRRLEAQRMQLLERRRWHMILVGGSLSLLIHIALLIALGFMHRGGHAGTGFGEATVEFAIEDAQGLSELEQTDLEDLVPEVNAVEEAEFAEASSDLNPAVPSAESGGLGGAGMLPALGASGGGGDGAGVGDGMGLGGGGGGTSFFGVSSKGTRFAYIVDVSGSMEMDRKLQTAMRELSRSIDALPDFAQFYIVLFSSGTRQPPGQRGWVRARKTTVRGVIRWLSAIEPNGGTEPKPAFEQVFSLDVRPDVIFFLTDGEVQDFTADECKAMNAAGRRAIINTIAFGEPASQNMLKQIAADSGGAYRFVPSGGGP